jgi:hypothetical protein
MENICEQHPIPFRFSEFIQFSGMKDTKFKFPKIQIAINKNFFVEIRKRHFYINDTYKRMSDVLSTKCSICNEEILIFFCNSYVYNCSGEKINPSYPSYCSECIKLINYGISKLPIWDEEK